MFKSTLSEEEQSDGQRPCAGLDGVALKVEGYAMIGASAVVMRDVPLPTL
jgi:hypothetical protein